MTGARWLLIATIGYVGIVALMYFMQRAMMYFPERLRTAPAAAGFAEAEEITLHTADGERVIAWHVAPRHDKPVVLYFHGNGGALRLRVPRFRVLTADGTGLIALSYRGYGGSSGRPSEAGLIADGLAAYEFAGSRYRADRIVLWGESLGSGVAVALAAQKAVWRVVLEAPFASAVDVAAHAYPFLPVRWLMKDQFRSDLRAGKIVAPVLILHGERDLVVPIASGERLYALINAPKEFVRFVQAGHANLSAYGAVEAAKKFLVAS
ncbi:MAG TPA: alpha/beta fold hydrolase [Xanthobacteraceae bacterium]|jgi:hypothetical protein